MELIIYQHPCWLLEAAELVHGLVNHTPAGAMVGEGPYCIPKDRLRSIQASACSGMDPEDPRVRFYFEDVPLEGLSDLMGTVRIVRRGLNPKLEIEGVLLTMFDGRTNLAIQVAQEIKRFFPGKVYSTVIPRNIRLSEAPSHGKPIHAYDRTCRGAEAYSTLADEFLRKNGIDKEE